jgi:predicted dehydrogenase
VQLAVIGGGLIGRRHIEHIIAELQSELYAIVDPAPVSEEMAKTRGVKWFSNCGTMIAAEKTRWRHRCDTQPDARGQRS